MKIIALLLMLLGVVLILALGAFSLLMFAMAFDAPGAAQKPGVWAVSLLIFLPLLAAVALLVLAFIAFRSGQYGRSAGFGAVFGVAAVAAAIYGPLESARARRQGRELMAKMAEEERLFPARKFMRHEAAGTDTIIVFPSRIVAYRMYARGDFPYTGPVGELNEARDAIVIGSSFDGRIRREEFDQFVDEQGRRLTDVFAIR
jgi:hypothetical protein